MKLRTLWILCLLPAFAGVIFSGCRRDVASPTFPATKTFTPGPSNTSTSVITNTPTLTLTSTTTRTATTTSTVTSSSTVTNSATQTATFTVTSTSTVTATPTITNTVGGPTNTFTSTPTITATSTITSTTTDTVTNTPTSAITPTYTVTACTVTSLSNSYTFEGSTDCWTIHSSSSTVAFGPSVSTTMTHNSSAGSLAIAVTEGTTTTAVQVELPFSVAQDMTGDTITLYVACDPSFAGCQVQLFTSSGTGSVWESGGWTTLTSGATWYMVSFKPTWVATGEDSTKVQQFGLQFYSMPTGVSGNVYVDDVTISGPPPASCQVLENSFESLSFTSNNKGVTTANGTVTMANGTMSQSSTHNTDGTYSLDLDVTTASGYNAGIFTWAGFTPNVMGTTYQYLMADVYADSSMISSSYSQMLLFADSGANSQYYKQISSTVPTLVAGQQTLVWKLDFPSSITSSMVLGDVFFIYNNGGGTTGNLYIDNVRFATCGS